MPNQAAEATIPQTMVSILIDKSRFQMLYFINRSPELNLDPFA